MPKYSVVTPSPISLTAATAKTAVAVLAPATRRVWVRGFAVKVASVTSTDAEALVEIVRWTTDGTATSQTPASDDPSETASLCTGRQNYTVEPTTPTILWEGPCPIFHGGIVMNFDSRFNFGCAVSSVIGLRITSPATQTSNISATLIFEE